MLVFAKKLGMTQLFDDKSNLICATIVNLEKTILAKASESQGSFALVKGGAKSPKSLNTAYKTEGIKKIVESNLGSKKNTIGSEIKIDNFSEGEAVTVLAKSKGKGFSGTVKRHGFRTGPKTHGSDNYRKPGSIGDTGPQRIPKGKKMSGRTAAHKVKIKNVKILKADQQNNNLWLSGPIPGPNKSVLIIEK